ncbi:MAG: hypothetical protein EPN75_03810 [Beijerinckiaceae bacterium]|nr:MAG: hypothetical protein EPN75_03810 [Beijerinckiaceae bacterium]
MSMDERSKIVGLFLHDLKLLLTEASGLASVGVELGNAGAMDRAIQKLFDIEPLLMDARTLLSAAILQHRQEKEAL